MLLWLILSDVLGGHEMPNKTKRKIIIMLLLVSGVCNVISKKLAGKYSGFVFPLPLPGWFFIVNRFCRYEKVVDLLSGDGLPLLKNALDVQSWHMPDEYYADLERFGLKRGKRKL
jgi:hypothetical protein